MAASDTEQGVATMKIPIEVLTEFDRAAEGLTFGRVCLEISFHDSKPKFRVIREVSYIPGKPSSGAQGEQ